MARIRTIKPEFWTDTKMAAASRDARLLFIGLLNMADDAGRFQADARLVKAAVFPVDDDLDSTSIRRLLDELSANTRLRLYEVGGELYGEIVNFKKHQKIDKPSPSRHPPFVEGSANPPRGLAVGSGSGSGSGRENYLTDLSPQAGTPEPEPKDSMHVMFQEKWALLPKPFPRISSWTSKRATALRTRLGDKFWREHWQVALASLPSQCFCRGENDRGWVADVDWFLGPNSVARILEGKYARPGSGAKDHARAEREAEASKQRQLDYENRLAEAAESELARAKPEDFLEAQDS